jgi:membrane protein DedA with SNARE-associated domain
MASAGAEDAAMVETLVHRFGYLAVFAGTFVEGETFILIGGFFAHRGYLGFLTTVSVATLGAFSGDLFYFFLGRRHGRKILQKSPHTGRYLPWLEGLMHRYHVLWIFGVRYLYGVRWLAAVLTGTSRISLFRFVTLALPACFIWAVIVGGLGFAVGDVMERILGNLEHMELELLLVVALVGVVYGILMRVRERRLSRVNDSSEMGSEDGE